MQRQAKEAERLDAAAQVDRFTRYLETLSRIHVDCGETWNWKQVATRNPPIEPQSSDQYEGAARAILAAYKPRFLERLFGQAKEKQRLLERSVEDAKQRDAHKHASALSAYKALLDDWKTEMRIAPGVLQLELDRCQEALAYVGAFDDLAALNTTVSLLKIDRTFARLACVIDDVDIVPREELRLTSTGKLSTKDMALGKFWSIYQDYVCSCAIRVAREAFAALPIDRAIVSVSSVQTDTSTGHTGPVTILAVSFTRDGIAHLNINAIDPSDSLRHFPHKMTFKKTSGFEAVEEISEDEQWVST